MTPWRDEARLYLLPDDPRPPGVDWLMALVWACLASMSVGFIVGVVFAVVELVR